MMAVGDELSVYVELVKQGRTSLLLRAEGIARARDGDAETLVAEGEFTFVALDENNRPRPIAAKEEDEWLRITTSSCWAPGPAAMSRRSGRRSSGSRSRSSSARALGGICLNWGCIPTKALLRSAEILHYAQHAQDYGLKLAGKIRPTSRRWSSAAAASPSSSIRASRT